MLSFLLVFAGCANTEKPLTEKEQAEKYNMTMQEYKETKEAAARMNMTIDDHMKMMEGEGQMDMKGSKMK